MVLMSTPTVPILLLVSLGNDHIGTCPFRYTGKMRLVRPTASGASSMVKSWDSFSDMVTVMVSVRGRVWIR